MPLALYRNFELKAVFFVFYLWREGTSWGLFPQEWMVKNQYVAFL